MKRAITSVVFIISFVSLLVLGLVSQVQAHGGECSNASIKGTYGLSCEGTVVGVGPLAVIGVFTADGNGTGPKWKRSALTVRSPQEQLLRSPIP